MRAARPRVLLLTVLALAASGRAQAYFTQGLDGVWTAQSLMAANPPLPALHLPPGAWSLKLQPSFYTGEPGLSESEEALYTRDGDFSGGGAGACLSYAVTERWGWYLWGLGSKGSGSVDIAPRPSCSGCAGQSLTGIESSAFTVSGGLLWQAVSTRRYSAQVFVGPVLSRTTGRQRVQGSLSGSPIEDFDMEVTADSLGLALGAQAALPLGRSFQLNPFVLTAWFAGDGCEAFEVTGTRLDSAGWSSLSSPDCAGAGARRIEAGESGLALSLGLNLTYLPWNLSMSLTSPWLGPYLARELDGATADLALWNLSWHFGGP